MKPTREQIEEQLFNAFREFMITGKMGINFNKKMADVLWEMFQGSLKWRLDALYEPQKGIRTKNLPDKYLFIQIPKNGSSSINKIIDQIGGHKTALQWKEYYSDEKWNNMYKFAIVRNPYDRFISAYYHADMHGKGKTIDDWLSENDIEDVHKHDEIVFKPQWDFVCDGKPGHDHVMVDMIGKLESIDKAWGGICNMTGIEEKLSHEHRQTHDTYKNVSLSKESKEKIYQYYKEDFELFGYNR